MKTYKINDTATETIEFRANENTFALVHRVKSSGGDTFQTIILNQREALILYQSLQDEILNKQRAW